MQEPMNDRLPEELRAFEGRLGGLRPAAAGIDRDRVLFEAGRAAGMAGAKRARRAAWAWRAGTIGGWAAAACVALALWPGGGGGAVGPAVEHGGLQRTVATAGAVEKDAARPEVAAAQDGGEQRAGWLAALLPAPSAALRERNLILSRGADALPEMPASSGGGAEEALPESYRVHRLLGPAKGFGS